jgi:hypothetical protein
MFDRMRIPAARENLAPPLLVGDLLVVDVLVEDARKSPDDLLDGNGAADDEIGGAGYPLGIREQTDSNPRDVFGRDQRQNGISLPSGRRMAPRAGRLAPTRRATFS